MTQELERRIRKDRRAKLDAYVSSILNARSGRDRRSEQQLLNDNAMVNEASERWYRNHPGSKAHA